MLKVHNGYVLHQGPSQIDGQEIVVVATGFKKKIKEPEDRADDSSLDLAGRRIANKSD